MIPGILQEGHFYEISEFSYFHDLQIFLAILHVIMASANNDSLIFSLLILVIVKYFSLRSLVLSLEERKNPSL